jgi:uncharacterized protein
MDELKKGHLLDSLGNADFAKLQLLVLQPTPFCNISCDYCYLPNRLTNRILSVDLLAQIFKVLFRSDFVGEEFTVVWHAGEPLVMPIEYYESAIQKINQLNTAKKSVTHALQTNGVLITQKWCDFFKDNNMNVGVSLDGPAFIHDAHRKTRSGKGTHSQTMQGISLLQRSGIQFHVIAVLTQNSLNFADEIFHFFCQNGINHIGFNIEEIEGVNKSSSLIKKGTDSRYRRFMNRIYRLMRESNGQIRIREFDTLIACMYSNQLVSHAQQITPFAIISVDCDGNFSTFSPELMGLRNSTYGDFTLGNIWKDTIESVCSSDKFLKMYKDINSGATLCKATCGYFDLCGGGAPANKYFENGTFDSSETMYCRYAIQRPIDIILDDLEKFLSIP